MFRGKEPGRRDLKHFRNKVQYHSLNFSSFSICMLLSFFFFFVCLSWRCIDILWIYYFLNDLTFCLVLPFDLNKRFVLNYYRLWFEFLCEAEYNHTTTTIVLQLKIVPDFLTELRQNIPLAEQHTEFEWSCRWLIITSCFTLTENCYLGQDSFRLEACRVPLCWTQIILL